MGLRVGFEGEGGFCWEVEGGDGHGWMGVEGELGLREYIILD